MFYRAAEIMESGKADKAVCLMDIPDDWNKGLQLELYAQTFDSAIDFAKKYPETLWCYGNHDLSYFWLQYESGFSGEAIPIVRHKLSQLVNEINEDQITYIHRIDDVLFLHGGLTDVYANAYTYGVDHTAPDAVDKVIREINKLGCDEMWAGGIFPDSPIWYRPQFYDLEMYKENELLQVVGHTPVEKLERVGNVISCDLFSTYRNGKLIGTQEFTLIDTKTWKFWGIK